MKRPDDPDLLYYLGQAHARLSRQVFDKLRAASPGSPRTDQILGEAHAVSGNRAAAEKHLRAALAARPDLRGVHYALGELALAVGEYAKAEPEFREEARLAPGSAAAAYKLGVVLANLGRTEEAITELERSNRLRAGMPETLFELGKALHASGDAKRAEPYLVELLRIEETGTLAEGAQLQLAQVYRKLGRAAEADRAMKRFQELRAGRK